MGGEAEEADGVREAEGAEDEMTLFQGDEAEEKGAAVVDRVERGMGGAVVGERGVVTIDDDDRAGGEEGFHGGGMGSVEDDGDVALPVGALGGRARTIVSQTGRGQLQEAGATGLDAGLIEYRGGRGDGNNDCLWGAEEVVAVQGSFRGDDLLDGEVLGGEDAIEAFEGEEATTVEDVGDVSLAEACLAGEKRAGEHAALDAAEELKAKIFMHVPKVHVYVFRTYWLLQSAKDVVPVG